MTVDLRTVIAQHNSVISGLEQHLPMLESIVSRLRDTFNGGNKVLVCGNGGSAADAQHFAAELTGRYLGDRRAYPAIALTTDTSALTSIGNDYGFDYLFRRQLEALGTGGDMLIAISTSGNSANVVEAVAYAREHGIHTVGLLGKNGGKLREMTDTALVVASDNTARIQEAHILILHMLCEAFEPA